MLLRKPSIMSLFTEKLKRLRNKASVDELADQCGVAASSIYKAEQTGRVKWETILRIYGRFFRGDHDRLETMVLWAMDQTGERFPETVAMGAASAAVRDDGSDVLARCGELAALLGSLGANDRAALLEFSRRFSHNESTRLMARTWMKVMAECGGKLKTEDPETEDRRPEKRRGEIATEGNEGNEGW
jgi:AcrR family transcriptional regulator